jgi:hypothetical protein
MSVEASYSQDGRLYVCFEDATGTVSGEGGISGPDGAYPAMVTWEMSAGSMLSYDVRELGFALIRLAEDADRLNAQHFVNESAERADT